MLIVPGEAAGSTYASSAAVTPEAALGPATPAKNTANVTGTVTIAARAIDELTAVPMMMRTLPASASPPWAISLSRRVPPKFASTSVANPPKAANVAICGLPITLSVIANRPGITSTARSARSAAARDHTGNQGVVPGAAPQRLLRADSDSAFAPFAKCSESNRGPGPARSRGGDDEFRRPAGSLRHMSHPISPRVRRTD